MTLMRAVGACATAVAMSSLFAAGTASASVTVPFQIDPAPYGNPNGSFDAPSIRCVAVVGDEPGVVTITGGKENGWGCLLYADVRWVNLSTGEAGSTRLSDGLNGIPAFATIDTGTGQVAVLMTPATAGPVTPGIATFQVPEAAPLSRETTRRDESAAYTPAMLIIGIILFGILVGAGAQLILGKSTSGIDWTVAFAAGVGGSFVGGLLISLLAGDGLNFRPSGIIGSIAGAIIVTAALFWWKSRSGSSVG